MRNDTGGMSCATQCWGLAAGAGVVILILLLAIGNTSFIAALFLGLLAFVLLGFLFNWLFCAPLPEAGSTRTAGTGAASAPAAAPAPVRAPATEVKAAPAAAKAPAPEPKAPEAKAPEAKAPEAKTPEAPAAEAKAPAAEAAAAASPAPAASGVKPSKALAGQSDLASRKGSWKYQGDTPVATKKPAKAAESAAKAAPAAQAAAVAGEGTKPKTLDAPRAGGADDLKRIKGIGPKLEQLCNRLGFYHFDQIAGWTAEEVAWVDRNLEGFKGRVTRDNWVDQARLLASGAETEFSKKVDKGGVY